MIDNLREEIQRRIDELSDEADRLRQALTALGGTSSSSTSQRRQTPARANSPRRRTPATPARTRQSRAQRTTQAERSNGSSRSRSGGTKESVLAALQGGSAMTASQVAQQTGLGRASVSTTLSKLVKSGEVQKAQRGYQLAGGNDRGSGAAAGATTE